MAINRERFTKSEQKELRRLGGLAYERDLAKALAALEEDFKRWKEDQITPFELSELIHKFHNGIARDLWSFYETGDVGLSVRRAIDEGIILKSEVSSGILEKMNMSVVDKQAVKDFKKAVTEAKNSRDMFWRSQASELASMLTGAIEQLKDAVQDPQIGAQALLDFYKRDVEIFERCDDSFGNVGDVFRFDAVEAFVGFARQCADKQKIADEILNLQEDSNYGVRDILIDKVSYFLDKKGIKQLIDKIEKRVPVGEDIVSQRKWLFMIESLARQIKDGQLFERTRERSWQKFNSRAYIEIAKVYFSAKDAKTAYDRLRKAAACGGADEYEYAELFRDVCQALGKRDEVNQISWDIFRRHRSLETLNELIEQIGEDKRAETIYKEVDLIMAGKEFDITDAEFLLDVGDDQCAQDYCIARREQLDGEQYYHLPALAEKLEVKGLYLGAVLIYRSLLEANLARALSKYYSHGVRYLRRLDGLANQVSDWHGIEPHDKYSQKIKQQHDRKSAFWTKYESA